MKEIGGDMLLKIEKAAAILGLPSPTIVTMTRRTLIHRFPDPQIRLAFIFTLIDECLDELNMSEDHAVELWKSGRRFL